MNSFSNNYFTKIPTTQQLKELFLEAIEVAFILCNAHHENYGLTKLLDVINQVIVTSIVLESSYWMFYTTNDGFPLCICRRYGINCKHKFIQHWINMHHIKENFGFLVDRQKDAIGLPINVSMDIIQVNNIDAVDVTINLMLLSIRRTSRNRCEELISPLYEIRIRYSFIYELQPLLTSYIYFHPHPSTHHCYGTIFPTLKQKYIYHSYDGAYDFNPTQHIIDGCNIPRTSIAQNFIAIDENARLRNWSTIINFYQPVVKIPRCLSRNANVATQTNLSEETVQLVPNFMNFRQTGYYFSAVCSNTMSAFDPNVSTSPAQDVPDTTTRSRNDLWQYDPIGTKKENDLFELLPATNEGEEEDKTSEDLPVSYASAVKKHLRSNSKK